MLLVPIVLKKGLGRENYLNFFRITDTLIDGAEKTNLNLSELVDLISTKKAEFLKSTGSAKFSKSVTIKSIENGETNEFSSITAAVEYLKSKNILADRNKISKWLDTGKPYKAYIFQKNNVIILA